jgi:hypothetical protein
MKSLRLGALSSVLFIGTGAFAQTTLQTATFETPPYTTGLLVPDASVAGQQGWFSTTTTASVAASLGAVNPHFGNQLLATQTRTGANQGRWWWLDASAFNASAIPNKIVVGTAYFYTGASSVFDGYIGMQAYDITGGTILGQIFYDEFNNQPFVGNDTSGIVYSFGTFGSPGTFDPRGAWRRMDLVMDYPKGIVRGYYEGLPFETATNEGEAMTDPLASFGDFDPYTFSFVSQAAKDVAIDTYRVRVYDGSKQTISGRVTFGDFDPTLTGGRGITVRLEDITNLGTVAATYWTTTDANGFFEVVTSLQGTFNIYVKGATWLQEDMGEYTFGPTAGIPNRTTPYTALDDSNPINGDVDGDNEVSILDYLELSAKYGLTTSDPGFNPNADLDGDGEVSILDYLILSANYGLVGDGPL